MNVPLQDRVRTMSQTKATSPQGLVVSEEGRRVSPFLSSFEPWATSSQGFLGYEKIIRFLGFGLVVIANA